MDNCEKFVALFSDHLEGFLTGRQKESLDAHLGSCPPCAARYAQMKMLRHRLRRLSRVKTSTDFDTVLRARIGFERRLKRQGVSGWLVAWPVKLSFYGVAASLVIIAAVLVRQEIWDDSRSAINVEALGNAATMVGQPSESPRVVYPVDPVSPNSLGSIAPDRSKAQPPTVVDSAAVQERLDAIKDKIQTVHVRM